MGGSSGGRRRGREGGRGGCCVAFGPFYGRCGVEEGGEAAVVEGSSELLLEEALHAKDGLDVSFVLGKHKGLRGGQETPYKGGVIGGGERGGVWSPLSRG